MTQIAALPGLEGMILDLRANAGGLVGAAVAVCDALLDEGVIVETRSRRTGGVEATEIRRATSGAALAGVPIVVLVDGLTASAAEIVAACLQDAGRATVVGSRTYGKGTVQSLIPLSDGRGLLKLTTAEYIRPSHDAIDRQDDAGDDATWGVRPDSGCEVTPTAEAVARLRQWRGSRVSPARFSPQAGGSSVSRTLPREIDPVLARGIEVIQASR